LPEHPAWEPPRPGERACFKTASLSFGKARSLHWIAAVIRPTIDPSGITDFGSLDSLTRTGDEYHIEGDWGKITLVADVPRLSLEPETE